MHLPNAFESLAISKCIASQHLGDDTFSLSDFVRSFAHPGGKLSECRQRKIVSYVQTHYVAVVTGDGERLKLLRWCCRNAQAIMRLEYR